MAGRSLVAGPARIPIVAAVAAAALACVLAERSPARTGVACNAVDDTAQMNIDDAGDASNASLGFTSNPPNDTIGFAHKYTRPDGTKGVAGGSCGGSAWLFVLVELGDRADRLRQDARKPQVPGVAGGVPSSVEVEAYGGGGPDLLFGHPGRDELFAQEGNDVIDVRGGGPDLADCGPGTDTLKAGANDVSFDCEN